MGWTRSEGDLVARENVLGWGGWSTRRRLSDSMSTKERTLLRPSTYTTADGIARLEADVMELNVLRHSLELSAPAVSTNPIGHFRVLLCLCLKTSLSAKRFIGK